MLFGRLKLYLILALLLAGIVGIAYWYYKDTQSRLQAAAEKNAILIRAKENPNTQKHLLGKIIVKEILVPNKLINFVVR